MAISNNYLKHYDSGPLGDASADPTVYDVMVIDNKAHRIHKVVVHSFLMGDVEDPDLMAGEPLWNWQQSEQGQWIMSKSVDTPEWHRMADYITFGHKYIITAKLKDVDYTFWTLKWGSK